MELEKIRRIARPLVIFLHGLVLIFLLWILVETLGGFLSPIKLIDVLGLGAITCLTLSLACTPINIIFNFPPVLRLRRLTGLYAFGFACLHLAAFFWRLNPKGWSDFWMGVLSSWAQQIGCLTFIILLVLAITSFKWWRRRMKRSWKRLHRTAYAAGLLAGLHLMGAPHSPVALGSSFFFLILLLLAIRLPPLKAWYIRKHAPEAKD